VNDPLLVRIADRLGDFQPDPDAALEVGEVLLLRQLRPVPLDPGGQRQALEVLQRQDDAGLVREGGIGMQDEARAAKAFQGLGLPVGPAADVVTLGVPSQVGETIDPQDPLAAGQGVAAPARPVSARA